MDYFTAMRAFVDAADLGSFSRAAERAGVKVSTVSRHIGALEADLGAALFNRSTRRIHLTEVGRTFYGRAVRVLADLDDARFAATSLNARPQGYLRVNLPGAFARRHVVPHLAAFRALHPDIRVGADLTETPLDLIESGIDVAVQTGTLADSTLVALRLAAEERLLVASPAYLARAGTPKRPADLSRHDCLLHAHNAGSWYFHPPGSEGGEALEVAVAGPVRINDPEALLETARAGLGVALLPAWLAAAEVRRKRLVALLPEWQGALSPARDAGIWAVYPPKKVVSPKVRAFLGFFSQLFGRPAYWTKD